MNQRIETMVSVIVATALVDKTKPDSANPRRGWHTDVLLQDADLYVVGQLNDPGTYAEMCRKVLARVRNRPEIAALVQIAIFRGERRLPMDAEREQLLVRMEADLRKAIGALPSGPRKERCESLLDFHVGVLLNERGLFVLAANMQERSATTAADRPGRAIALFMRELYLLKDALHKGDMARANAQFSMLEGTYANAVEVLLGSPLEESWAKWNCPTHMVQACLWLNRTHPDWSKWVGLIIATSEKLGEAYKFATELVRAADMVLRVDPGAIDALNDVANDICSSNEIKATALLLLARDAMDNGETAVASDIVSRMQEPGAQHVCSVARLLLA